MLTVHIYGVSHKRPLASRFRKGNAVCRLRLQNSISLCERPSQDQTHRKLVYRPALTYGRGGLDYRIQNFTLIIGGFEVPDGARQFLCSVFGLLGLACLRRKLSYQVHRRNDKRGVDLISDALPFGRLWCDGTNAAINSTGYAEFYSRSHPTGIHV